MARFDRQIATALRLIKKYGQTVQMTTPTTTVNPDKPWETTSTVDVKDVVICFLPMNRFQYESLTLKTDTEVPKGAVLAYMGQVDFTPNLKSTVLRDGKVLNVHYMDLLSPNGQKILYTMVLGE